MTRINTNLSSLTAQHSLKKSNASLETALTRLSTGLRINSGKDDPAGLIASEQLRTEVTSISQSIKNSERAGNMIATADAALGEVSSLLNDVRSLIQSSANKGAVSAQEIAANQVEVDNALDAITRIGQTTVFGGQKLLNGTKSFSVSGTLGAFNSPTDISINTFDPSLHSATANDDVALTVTSQATKKSVAFKGSDQNTSTSNSLLDLSVGTSTRSGATVVTNDFSLVNATSSLNSLSTGSVRASQLVDMVAVGGFDDLTGAGTDTVTLSVSGELGTAAVVVNIAAAKADSNVFRDAVNTLSTQTGVIATGSGGVGDVTLQSTWVGTKVGAFTNLVTATAATQAGDVAAFNGAGTRNAFADGSFGAIGMKSTTFTITGNKGTADISTAALVNGTITGNDVIINNNPANNTGITAFAALINTRTDSTGVVASVNGSGNLVLTSQGVGSTSLASLTVGSAGADQNVLTSASTTTATTGSDGTSNTSTFEILGDAGRAVITVNNDAVINDSTVLRNAINAVTSQTGITAAGGGFGVDVTLTAQKYGSAGIATVNALAASNSADITLLNAAGSRKSVAGVDATGTVSHSKGGGSFTGIGERITYTDSALSFDASVDPTLTPAVRATRTIQDTTAGAGGLDSLSAVAATDTISFQLSGVVNGVQVTTNINNVNVAALKGDSRVLADLINATSSTSGVRASTTGAGGNIVLESTTLGASGAVGITATAATQAGDLTVFNNADTFTAIVAGSNPSVASNFDVTGGALFQIGPSVNYSNQVNVNITSLDLATLGRNITTTGNKGISALKSGGTDSLDKSDLGTAATIVEQAISAVATLRGKLGAISKNAVESNIRSLQSSLEQVTAAKSTISDADFAVETAALTRSQILVQAGTNVLALANQAPQNVLSLLRG